MRSTHARFVTWTFSPKHIKNALSFGKYGPLGQGAFYQGHFDTHRSPAFNWKPYWGKPPGEGHEKPIHFHGPKPLEYIEHVNNPAGVSSPAMSRLLQLCDQSSGCYEWVDLWLWYNNDSRMLNDALTPVGRMLNDALTPVGRFPRKATHTPHPDLVSDRGCQVNQHQSLLRVPL